jgi:hypothetical protein
MFVVSENIQIQSIDLKKVFDLKEKSRMISEILRKVGLTTQHIP